MWHQITRPASVGDVAVVVELATAAQPRCGATVVVAIDGPSGAGKTTLARGVADALAAVDTVEVVHMDLLFPGWDGLSVAPGLLTSQVLEPIDRGEPASFRTWSWVRDEWRGTHAVATSRFLVVEGCGCSVGPARRYTAVRVFVEADREVRMERGIARDGEAYRPHWQRWADQEAVLFEGDRTRDHADLVVDTTEV